MRHAEPVDPAGVALLLEPLELLLPRDEVVDLLDLDAAVPAELPAVLLAALLDRARPDLRRDVHPLAPALERGAERRLRAAVHRRRVDETRTGVERRADDARRRAPASPPNVLHVPRPTTGPSLRSSIYASNRRAARPAANAAAKKDGSSSGPRPMCASGKPLARLAPAQTSTCSLPSGLGDRTALRPGRTTRRARNRATASVWCETPRWRGASVGLRDARREDRSPAERGRRVRGLRGGHAAVPEREPGADDAGADRADDRFERPPLRPTRAPSRR